jgi:hypothetical protein
LHGTCVLDAARLEYQRGGMNMLKALSNPAFQGIGVYVTIAFALIGFYITTRNKTWLYFLAIATGLFLLFLIQLEAMPVEPIPQPTPSHLEMGNSIPAGNATAPALLGNTAIPTPLTISPVPDVQTPAPIQPIYSLQATGEQDLYTLGDAQFTIDGDKTLSISGNFYNQVYINRELPDNFRATIRFEIRDAESQFIAGISDGTRWKPNYHFVMTPYWSALKEATEGDTNWDHQLTSVSDSRYFARPGVPFEVVFERKDGAIRILVNSTVVATMVNRGERIDNYSHLYVTSGRYDDQKGGIIESMHNKEVNMV